MMNMRNLWVVSVVLQLIVPIAALAQYPADFEAKLRQLAASDPDLAQALLRQSAAAGTLTYSRQDLVDHLMIEMNQYRLSPDPAALYTKESGGRASVPSLLSSGINWIDKGTGESVWLTFDASTELLAHGQLILDLTIEADGAPPAVTRHVFENLAPVSVVLRTLPDGTKHVVQFTPIIEPKQTSVEFSHNISLEQAVLLAGRDFAGVFSQSGPIVGITSSKAKMGFEFGLRPFADAKPIGRTDGRSIRFDYDGVSYRLYSTEAITVPGPEGTWWNVYVRGWPIEALGTGTHVKMYDTLLIQEAMESMSR